MAGTMSSRPRQSALRVLLFLTIATLAGTEARGQYEVVSTSFNGFPLDGPSDLPVVSGNGRYVAFTSAATNLVPGDTNGSWDVFVKDRQTGATVRVSVTSAGEERIGDSGGSRVAGNTIDISDDGQVIVFASYARLVDNDTNRCAGSVSEGACQDIYVHVRATGETSRVLSLIHI